MDLYSAYHTHCHICCCKSFDGHCFQGPHLNIKLISVLLRFRQYQYVLMADVEAIYLQVRIPYQERKVVEVIKGTRERLCFGGFNLINLSSMIMSGWVRLNSLIKLLRWTISCRMSSARHSRFSRMLIETRSFMLIDQSYNRAQSVTMLLWAKSLQCTISNGSDLSHFPWSKRISRKPQDWSCLGKSLCRTTLHKNGLPGWNLLVIFLKFTFSVVWFLQFSPTVLPSYIISAMAPRSDLEHAFTSFLSAHSGTSAWLWSQPSLVGSFETGSDPQVGIVGSHAFCWVGCMFAPRIGCSSDWVHVLDRQWDC